MDIRIRVPILLLTTLLSSVLVLTILGASYLIDIGEDEELEIIWLVNDVITASEFPIGFFTKDSTYNVSINTTWGAAIDIKITPISISETPYIEWIQVPDTMIGTGNVSISVDNALKAIHSISWEKLPTTSDLPLSVSVSYEFFSNWAGQTQLDATFWANHSVSINHTIIYSYIPKDLPYNRSFSFTSFISDNGWTEVVQYLQINNSYRWQSWSYQSPTGGIVDGGGYKISLIIQWNATYQCMIIRMVDNDNGNGARIYTTSTAVLFQNLLLMKVEALIDEFLGSDMTTDSSITLSSATVITPSTSPTGSIPQPEFTPFMTLFFTIVVIILIISGKRFQ